MKERRKKRRGGGGETLPLRVGWEKFSIGTRAPQNHLILRGTPFTTLVGQNETRQIINLELYSLN